MGVVGYDHIVLTVKNIEQTCQFYEKILSFQRVEYAGGKRVALHSDFMKINLHQNGERVDENVRHATVGSADFCLIVDEPISELMRRLNLLDIPVIEGPNQCTGTLGPIKSIYVYDPDENLLEISSRQHSFFQIPNLKRESLEIRALEEEDLEALQRAGEDDRIWEHNAYVKSSKNFKDLWWKKAWFQKAMLKRLPLTILFYGEAVGSTSFYNYELQNKSVYIGYTWFNPKYWGTGMNQTVKAMLLDFSFHELGLERVGFHIDNLNIRSQKAVEKLGASYEGTIRKDIIRVDGSSRDTRVYSLLKNEWREQKNNGML